MSSRATRFVSVAPLAGFRVAFGLLVLYAVGRFWAHGWIEELYLRPRFFFPYYGFGWVRPLPAPWLYGVFGLLALSALGVALGAYYRLSALLLLLSFGYVELLDKTNYLNHYYYVTLAAALLGVLPAHRAWSVDAWRRGADWQRPRVPAWVLWAVKAQVGSVYFFGGVAKLKADWLLHAQPLRIWLAANSSLPLVGPLLDDAWVAYAVAWFACLFDLTVPFFLWHDRTRPWAYAVVVAFHLLTAKLFYIGIFPWAMIVSTWVFFRPETHARVLDWLARIPRRLASLIARAASRSVDSDNVARSLCFAFSYAMRSKGSALQPSYRLRNCSQTRSFAAEAGKTPADRQHGGSPALRASATLAGETPANRQHGRDARVWTPSRRLMAVSIVCLFLLQLVLPFRYLLYPGDVCWHEQGFRYAWHIMLIEKAGTVDFHVRDPRTGRQWTVNPGRYLSRQQARMLSTQPDMLVQFAHLLNEEEGRGLGYPLEVRAEAWVSLNGRPAQLLVDPAVDLVREEDSFANKSWILPLSGPQIQRTERIERSRADLATLQLARAGALGYPARESP